MTFLFEKQQDPLNTLALAALAILIADPPSLFSISFQLSFTAVLAIICGFSWLQNRAAAAKARIKDDWRLRLVSRLVSFFLVSFFAICGSLPLVAFYFNQISIVGLAANFVVVPLVGFIAIPLGLVALFVLPLSTTLAFWCIKAGGGILTYALGVVQFFADLPFAAVKTFTPSLLEIGCFYVLCWALLNLYRDPRNVAVMSPSITGIAIKPVPSKLEELPSGNDSGLRRFLNILRMVAVQKDFAKQAGKSSRGIGTHYHGGRHMLLAISAVLASRSQDHGHRCRPWQFLFAGISRRLQHVDRWRRICGQLRL